VVTARQLVDEPAPARRPGGAAPYRAGDRPDGRRGIARRRPFRRLTWVGKALARKHAVRPGKDGFVAPRLDEVKVPLGYRPVTDPAEMLQLFQELPAVASLLRSDAWHTRRAIWQVLHGLLRHGCDWGDPMVIAGHETIAVLASKVAGKYIARSTVGNHMRAMEAANVLFVALRGASKEVLGTDRHRAPVYVVLAPVGFECTVPAEPLSPDDQAAVDELAARLDAEILAGRADRTGRGDLGGHPPVTVADDLELEGTHPRKTRYFSRSEGMSRSERKDNVEPATPARRAEPGRYAPRSAADRRIAVAWLAATMGWPWKSGTEEELVKITGPWFSAGWSPNAVLKALLVQPDGAAWPGPLPEPHQRDRRDRIQIRNLWAVLTHRLQAWTDPLGVPLDPPIPTSRPPRGRPRKPTAAAAPVVAGPAAAVTRSSPPPHVAAELAAQAARRAAAAAERAAAAAARPRYQPPQPAQAPEPVTPAVEPRRAGEAQLRHERALFRARIERRAARPPR
jgi:hypothetical protein